MNWPIIAVAIEDESDVVAVRQRARRIAGLLGFESQDQTRIATAVSEIARNAHTYGGGGRAEFSLVNEQAGQSLMIRISDEGGGIEDLDSILEGRHTSQVGIGVGISGARRLVDAFEIKSNQNEGTSVILSKRLPRKAERVGQKALGIMARDLVSETPANPLHEVRDQNRELLLSLAAERARQDELGRLNSELQDTNRGVVALYAELDEQAEQLRRASELKSRFLSNMSHEFRTPLNSITALSRLLLDHVDGTLTEEQTRQVEFIRTSAASLTELVNDLLDIAKVEAGKTELRVVDFTVSDLFGGLRGALRPLRVGDEVDLVFEEPVGMPPIRADEGKVAQILRNFVSNALKFTERGEVRVSARMRDENTVLFAVQDTGLGIATEHHLTIFQEFSQLDNPLQGRIKGTGLGLPLSKKFADLLGGEVYVESALGEGSTFFLALPLGGKSIELAEASSPTNKTKRILVVDDDHTFRYVFRQLLADTGYEIAEAVDGAEGLELLTTLQPEVVFLDLYLPRRDGFSVLQDIRRIPAERKPVVIVVTSSVLGPVERARLAAADAVIPKEELSRKAVLSLLPGA
ncbi:sensor histidine kinase [Labrys miyagiensis]|uniref:histidine kinase n=1 Tax=Labrys miyagiensis TaxID=346912 RepID=A0ABQ6CTA1_9HYPH|nr:ATP-binding protein [Labrys miyagiensis]GLS22995.1 sensor histidine kinase [Labrys miyagiensis]